MSGNGPQDIGQGGTPRAVRKRSPWEIQRAVIFALFIRELQTRMGGRWLGWCDRYLWAGSSYAPPARPG